MFFALIAFLVGALALWSAWHSSRTMRDARRWPTVSGAFIERGVGARMGRISYAPHVKYAYRVNGKDYVGADDPGVESVTTIYNYYKKFGYKTVVMGASFRNIGKISELAGCDLLTIAPKLLEELESIQGTLPRKLDPAKAAQMDIKKLTIDKATFDKMHAADRMVTDKLKEGIEGFSKAIIDLEAVLEKRLSEISEPATAR